MYSGFVVLSVRLDKAKFDFGLRSGVTWWRMMVRCCLLKDFMRVSRSIERRPWSSETSVLKSLLTSTLYACMRYRCAGTVCLYADSDTVRLIGWFRFGSTKRFLRV